MHQRPKNSVLAISGYLRKGLVILFFPGIPLIAIGDELILDEDTARAVIAEMSAASRSFDVEVLRKYVDSESRFVWKTTIEGGKDGREANGDEWLGFVELFAGMEPVSEDEFKAEIRSVTIDPALNQATIIEDYTTTTESMFGTYEEQGVETNTLGIRDGSIKVIYSERVTTQLTQID